MSGGLLLVGTPIGNLSDFSPRAIEALQGCDVIAAEDTRVTRVLLTHFDIKKPLVSYHEHNAHESGRKLCERMLAGEQVALVTDAGMPAISDPGELLVAQCHELGIPVHSVPGPTAMATAVALSGLPSARFAFEGFPDANKQARRAHFEEVAHETRTTVWYEAPHKLLATLTDMHAAFGDRRIALCRELTKLYEEVKRTTLADAVAFYSENAPRGEFVLVVEGAPAQQAPRLSIEEAVSLAQKYRAEGLRASDAARQAAAETGYAKSDLYRLMMQSDNV